MLLSYPSEDVLKLPTKGHFSHGRQQKERAHGRAPWLLVPSSPPEPEEWRAQLSLHASLALLQDIPVPQGSHTYKTHTEEEMMGLAWKKLSSQLYRRTSLSSAMPTHMSTDDSPAPLLQKPFLPALLQQPGSFVGYSPTGKAPAVGVTSFHCGMDLVCCPGQTHAFLVCTEQHFPGRTALT